MLSTKLESSVFLSTPSARRATHTLAGLNLARGISTHALREEGDGSRFERQHFHQGISTHALREEGDVGESGHCHFRQVISTHALREEGDVELRQPVYKVVEFLPTPSARRATEPAAYCLGSKKFLPTPSARRATGAVFVFARYTDISTHALREEGDRVFLRSICPLRNFYPRPPRGGRRGDKLHPGIKLVFLSTPSARRATLRTVCRCHQADISIHALREEGDSSPESSLSRIFDFYPRPPRGGRPIFS